MSRLLLVALFGAVGTTVRLLVHDGVNSHASHGQFPWGTLLVNIVGSLAIGALYSLSPDQVPTLWRNILGLGLLGGLTTYSTFAFETLKLVDVGRTGMAITYASTTFVGALVAVGLGAMAARSIS